ACIGLFPSGVARLLRDRCGAAPLSPTPWRCRAGGAARTHRSRAGRELTHVQNTLTQPFFFFLIQETISDNCVVIFSKTTCGYCKMAKKLFQDMNVNYTAVELDLYENGSQFQDILHQMTGGRTVPRVFINGAFIGGATDTQRLHQEGKLLPLVHQCQMRRAKNSDLPCSLP
uniref:Glutaredoxin-2, mitochondrial n=1 Tax=Chelonoidis abingdonii TaxID=106734 RepID=A0A8C0QQX8_CHEAB